MTIDSTPTRATIPASIHYLAEAAPEPGLAVEIAPGILWLRMPLPFALNHVNLWAIDDVVDGRAGWTVIDTGIGFDETRDAWRSAFDAALGGRPIVRLICTHMHPDHVGLSGWLCERFGCRLSMTQAEYLQMRMLSAADTVQSTADSRAFLLSQGLDADTAEIVAARTGYYQQAVRHPPTTFDPLFGEQLIMIGGDEWRVIIGYGHSIEHAGFYCARRNLLISGDMLLPRISTNVSVNAIAPNADPLGGFLASIARYRELPADVMVLPSHGLPFGRNATGGAHSRVDQLERHHADRLAELEAFCEQSADGVSAADVIPVMFRRELDQHQMGFATGEALAHLHWLWLRGKLVRSLDADGVHRFRA
jgi:glyoxylase-like metal-dependent hydrolase (beta-lactamase superfamily II)